MNEFNDRLKLERKRLGLSQDKFAALGGVTRDTQMNYENGSRKPDSAFLEAVARAGVDVLFLLTGEQARVPLSDEESALLDAYRTLDIRGKAGVLGMIGGLSTPVVAKPAKRKQSIVFHGDIGQQVTGDITAPQTIKVGSKKK